MRIFTRTLCALLALLLLLSCAALFAGCRKKRTGGEMGEEDNSTGDVNEDDGVKTGLQKYPRNSKYYNYAQSLNFVGGYDEGAKALRNEILNAANTADIYDLAGKNVTKLPKGTSVTTLKKTIQRAVSGDVILLERGGLWRIGCDSNTYVNAGVILGAYGTGEKPKLYGSTKNYAGDEGWARSAENNNIWTITLAKNNDVGNIVFDEIACLGVHMWSLDDVKKTYDFYFNSSTRVLYLYYPDDLKADFTDIEICQRGETLQMRDNTVLDNICLRYSGAFAVNVGHQISNVTITNCEIGFIGGALQMYEGSKPIRYGNGIQLGMGSIDSKISHNWVYQCYDAGITFQSWNTGKATYYHNVEISRNLVEFCCYNIEYFTTNMEGDNPAYSDYKNIHIVDNILRFSGYDWGYKQRPDPEMCSQIRGGQWAWVEDCEDFLISGNVFDCAGACTIFWWWNDPASSVNHNADLPGVTVEHNTYYIIRPFTTEKRNRCVILYKDRWDYLEVNRETQAREAIAKFDKNPTAIVWVSQLAPEEG